MRYDPSILDVQVQSRGHDLAGVHPAWAQSCSIVTASPPDLLRQEDLPVQFGEYTLLRLLGEGGMPRVFEAELRGPQGFRKRAAVKVDRLCEPPLGGI